MSPLAAAPAAAPLLSPTVSIPSRLFGPLVVSQDVCFHFPDGVLGFGGERRFALLPAQPGLYWLQSVEQGSLAFLLVDPFEILPGYAVDLPAVPAVEADATMVLAIVTLPASPTTPATANVQGPIVLDLARKEGRQMILENPTYPTRYPFDLDALAGTA